MILDLLSLKKALKNQPGKALYDKAATVHKELIRLIRGEGLDGSLKKPDFIENKDYQQARELLKKSTADLFERILKLRAKVFTANGGARVFGVSGTKEKAFIAFLSSVRNEQSLKDYIQYCLLPAWDCDPMGLVFVEVSDDVQNPEPYPTYKASSSVYAIKLKGRKVDYVILDLTKEDLNKLQENGIIPQEEAINPMSGDNSIAKLFKGSRYKRVVDDNSDYIIKFEDADNYEVVTGSETPNPWGYVPAFLVSNLVDYNTNLFTSTCEGLIELGNRYLERDADLALMEKLHGTPKYWTHPVACSNCGGSKYVHGKDCQQCKGTGVELNPKLSSTLIIPENTTDASYSIPPCGFVVPPSDSFVLIENTLYKFEAMMKETYWGDVASLKARGPNVNGQQISGGGSGLPTATEVLSTNNKEEMRLNQLSDWAQETETILTDIFCQYFFPGSKDNSITYGRNYLLKTWDELKNAYEESRAKMVSVSILDKLYNDYLESRFEGDKINLTIEKTRKAIEPFFHYTLSEVKLNIGDFEVVKAKALFGEWAATKVPMDFLSNIADLKADFAAFVAASPLEDPIQETETLSLN